MRMRNRSSVCLTADQGPRATGLSNVQVAVWRVSNLWLAYDIILAKHALCFHSLFPSCNMATPSVELALFAETLVYWESKELRPKSQTTP
jgi:hypothetical protein